MKKTENKEQQIKKYEKKIRDLVEAYKSLSNEKDILIENINNFTGIFNEKNPDINNRTTLENRINMLIKYISSLSKQSFNQNLHIIELKKKLLTLDKSEDNNEFKKLCDENQQLLIQNENLFDDCNSLNQQLIDSIIESTKELNDMKTNFQNKEKVFNGLLQERQNRISLLENQLKSTTELVNVPPPSPGHGLKIFNANTTDNLDLIQRIDHLSLENNKLRRISRYVDQMHKTNLEYKFCDIKSQVFEMKMDITNLNRIFQSSAYITKFRQDHLLLAQKISDFISEFCHVQKTTDLIPAETKNDITLSEHNHNNETSSRINESSKSLDKVIAPPPIVTTEMDDKSIGKISCVTRPIDINNNNNLHRHQQSSSFHSRADKKRNGGRDKQRQLRSANNHDKIMDEECPEADDYYYTGNGGPRRHLYFYQQEVSGKDRVITFLKKKLATTEQNARMVEKNYASAECLYRDQLDFLKEEIRRLENLADFRSAVYHQHYESSPANHTGSPFTEDNLNSDVLLYLRNLFLNYLKCTGGPQSNNSSDLKSKKSIIRAIASVLKFTPGEMSQIKSILT